MLSGEIANTNLMSLVLTRAGIEPKTFRTGGGNAKRRSALLQRFERKLYMFETRKTTELNGIL